MVKLQPKKELDIEILKEIIKYYRIDKDDPSWDPEEFLEWECFSHPSLELHECNCRTRLPGGHLCQHCNHVVGKPCPISCDFQTFCLAVFAWRMGVGDPDFKKALKHNLYVLRPEELYDEVIKKFTLGDTYNEIAESTFQAEKSDEVEEVAIDDDFVEKISSKSTPQEGKVKEVPSLVPLLNHSDDLLSIKEASTVYGCTYANIYNYIKGGRLPSISKNGKLFVNRANLMAFKDRSRRIKK